MNKRVMLNIDVVGTGDSAVLNISRYMMDRREELQTIKADFWKFNFKLGSLPDTDGSVVRKGGDGFESSPLL